MEKHNHRTTFDNLHQRRSALHGFDWQFVDPAPDPEAQNADWNAYVLGLEDQFYGRDLSELEEQYEWSRWLRTQSMLKHLDEFRQLLDVAYDFVVALTDAGGQRLLAERAGLSLLSRPAWPSDWVQFKGVDLPEPPPLAVAEYARCVGGPHVLGARLLWWCAAAKNPKDFDFVGSFTHLLRTQPFWVTTHGFFGRSTRANPYPLSLMREAAWALTRLATSGSCHASVEAENEPAETEEGPCPIRTFRYRGAIMEFTETEWRLLDYLWRKRSRRAYWEEALDDLWGDDATKAAIQTAASRINSKFKAESIPLHVGFDSEYVRIEDVVA